ncbi:MAG: MAPEG family protein [Gammaproteobacteria bacterium]
MPVELKVLGYAALLQFVQFVLMAVPVNVQLGTAYTGGNRDEQKMPWGVAGRLKRALDNHFEGLILFTIAVVVVVLGDASSPVTEGAAWAYLIARVLYVPAYASGVFLVRSLIWTVGFVATAIMLVVGLF